MDVVALFVRCISNNSKVVLSKCREGKVCPLSGETRAPRWGCSSRACHLLRNSNRALQVRTCLPRVYQKGHASTGSQCAMPPVVPDRPSAIQGRSPALQGRPPAVPRIHRKKSSLPVFIFIHPRKSLVHLSTAVGVRIKSHTVALWNSNSLDWL